jgi:flagellar motor protein MotB
VASNDNAAGRQQNRRVELVVSGDEIGNNTTSSIR